VFSRVRSAYVRFNFAFSALRLRSRFNSGTVVPAYFRFPVKQVARLMPCAG
jgi:hypothetical protein